MTTSVLVPRLLGSIARMHAHPGAYFWFFPPFLHALRYFRNGRGDAVLN